jgi:hypothetical protein
LNENSIQREKARFLLVKMRPYPSWVYDRKRGWLACCKVQKLLYDKSLQQAVWSANLFVMAPVSIM